MAMQVSVLLAIGLIFLAIAATRVLLHVERFRLRKLDEYSNKYSDAMRTVLSADVEWTEHILAKIDRWNRIAGHKDSGLPLAIALIQLKKSGRKNKPMGVEKPYEEFFARYPKLEQDFIKMELYAILTACFSQFFLWPSMIDNYAHYMENHPKETKRFTEIAQRKVGGFKVGAVLST